MHILPNGVRDTNAVLRYDLHEPYLDRSSSKHAYCEYMGSNGCHSKHCGHIQTCEKQPRLYMQVVDWHNAPAQKQKRVAKRAQKQLRRQEAEHEAWVCAQARKAENAAAAERRVQAQNERYELYSVPGACSLRPCLCAGQPNKSWLEVCLFGILEDSKHRHSLDFLHTCSADCPYFPQTHNCCLARFSMDTQISINDC